MYIFAKAYTVSLVNNFAANVQFKEDEMKKRLRNLIFNKKCNLKNVVRNSLLKCPLPSLLSQAKYL